MLRHGVSLEQVLHFVGDAIVAPQLQRHSCGVIMHMMIVCCPRPHLILDLFLLSTSFSSLRSCLRQSWRKLLNLYSEMGHSVWSKKSINIIHSPYSCNSTRKLVFCNMKECHLPAMVRRIQPAYHCFFFGTTVYIVQGQKFREFAGH